MTFFLNNLARKANLLLKLFLLLIAVNCAKVDPVTGEKILIEVDPKEKAKKAAEQGGGIFGNILRGETQNPVQSFANSNVLWKATLKSLDFLPLLNADYGGGIIIYDWYSQNNNFKEQIKISVQFLSNEVRSDSIKIIAHKKICESVERCSNSTLDQNFANSIKDSIINSARILKIEESKKEKK